MSEGVSYHKSQTCVKNNPSVETLPPLCPRSSSLVAQHLFSRSSLAQSVDSPLSVGELPQLIAQVGPGTALQDSKWTEGPQVMASALGTELPVRAAHQSVSDIDHTVNAHENKRRITGRKLSKSAEPPQTVADVLQMFTAHRDQRQQPVYYLKEVNRNFYRPYDLRVIPPDEAGSEHYIFSSTSVLHVTESGYGGLISLAEWYRESVYWKALQKFSFFRDFQLRKAFSRWHTYVRKMAFLRRCQSLQEILLMDVTLFRNALFLLADVMEEVRGSHWLPQDQSKTYTLEEFTNAQLKQKQEFQIRLRKLCHYRSVVLNMVKKECHTSHHKLCCHVEYAQRTNLFSGSIHLHVTHQQELKRDLLRAKNTLHQVQSFAKLINHMIVQSLVTVIQQDSICFLRALQSLNSLFQTELSISANNQLTVDQSPHLFQMALSDALLTAKDFIIKTCDKCGFFLDISSEDLVPGFASCLKQKITKLSTKSANSATGGKIFRCCQLLRHQSTQQQGLLTHQELGTDGCHYPLNRNLLEWHLSISDMSKHVEGATAQVMQAAQSDLERLCEGYTWLVDVHAFVGSWSPASVEALESLPAALYEEHIHMVRCWRKRLHSVPSSFTSTNQLFVVDCTNINKKLEQQLKVIEEHILNHLLEQVQLLSEGLTSDLERASAELQTRWSDLQNFSEYALKVRRCFTMLADLQKQLEYAHSFQRVISTNYREMNEEERTRNRHMQRLWDCFLLLLKDAESIVCQELPVHVHTLDIMFSFMVSDLTEMMSRVSCGPFLDPTQNAQEMASRLHTLCMHVQSRKAKLEQLSRNSSNLQEKPMDLAVLTREIKNAEIRKDLWELLATCTTWVEEWKPVLFTEAQVSQAKVKMAEWRKKVLCLTGVPSDDAILQETLNVLEHLSSQVEVMCELESSALKHKHWAAILKGLGLAEVSKNELTVGQLLSQQIELHQNLLSKICCDAQAEYNMERCFQSLQGQWEAKLLKLENSITTFSDSHCDSQSCSDHTGTITDLEVHLAQTELDLIILSNMLKSPHSVDFRTELENWVQLLQKLDNLLHLFKRFQQMWTFLTKVFKDVSIGTDLLKLFHPVDAAFKKIMQHIFSDPHILHLVCSKSPKERFCCDDIYQTLIAGLSTMESISVQMAELFTSVRHQCPRLGFLSDREVMLIYSSQPNPSIMLPFVCRLFKGVQELEVVCENPPDADPLESCVATSNSQRQENVLGIFGRFQEHITFLSPLFPSRSAMVWLCDFERQLKLAIVELMKQCALVQDKLKPPDQLSDGDLKKRCLHVLSLLNQYPVQCLLVAEEAVWCKVIQEAFQRPVKFSNLKAYIRDKLTILGCFIRNGVVLEKSHYVAPDYVKLFLRVLVQITMNHWQELSQLQTVQGELDSSFEWLSLMRYSLSLEDSKESLCFIDVLGQRLHYGYEYVGPADWLSLHSPPTDRAKLGILLALTNYRCGFMSGPCKTAKKNLVVQLGKALGRMVFVVECSPSMKRVVVENMFLGSLQIGAWILLDSVDLLAPAVFATLSQFLVSIHESFSEMTKKNQRCGTDARETGYNYHFNSKFNIVLAERNVSVSLNYGCVLVSSKGRMCDLPDDLLTATRPIALTHPDYRVIAEVMLTSLGFIDAVFLSQRLVSLMNLSEDCLCLPGSNNTNESCRLVILQNIISSSELYLEQCRSQQETSKENGSTKDNGHKFPYLSAFSVVRGLMEEAAVVKSILSVLIPFTYEQNKASEFYQLLKDTFPLVCQFPSLVHYLDESEKNQVKAAISAELQMNGFQPETDIISSALTVYQSMKSGKAVILSGPSGSGKTCCYSALAGALNTLTAKTEKHERFIETGTGTTWSFVEPVVLFPNAMSHEEMFGHDCEKRGWQDGMLTKILRDSAEECEQTVVKWLVLDGEPVGEPGWMDFLTTLCNPADPFLCLPSGEHIVPSQTWLHIVIEVTDLSNASPSAVTTCSLVHFTGTELWKAVWKSQMHDLCSKHHLDQRILKMWECLAEDLFSTTLHLLSQNRLSSAIHYESESSRFLNHGLQEIMSFFRILVALLQHFGMCLNVQNTGKRKEPGNRDISLSASNETCITSQNKEKEVLARNCFLVSYCWGFGGHLHPSFWPRFDSIAREVLLNCCYRIEVPNGESVFEYFFTTDRYLFLQTSLLTSHITPKYGVYTHLLNIMSEANQSVLLAGEPGSGKTTLFKSLPSFDKPYVSLAGSPLLSPKDLCTVLRCCITAKSTHMLLFLDDLHEAPCDVAGATSKALEALRQSISKGGILMFSDYSFLSLSSAAITYMATSCVFGPHHSAVLSPRLTRLFSIFVLPSLSLGVILSLYSPSLKLWLGPYVQNTEEMASCIISATHSLYLSLHEHFKHSVKRPRVFFSIHDLHKVFQGMTLWRCDISNTQNMANNFSDPGIKNYLTNSSLTTLNIMKLWLHECMHTFNDRVCEWDEHAALATLIANIATIHFDSMLTPLSNLLEQSCTELSSLPENNCSPESGLRSNSLSNFILQFIGDIMSKTVYGPELSVLLHPGDIRSNFKQISYKEHHLGFLAEQLSHFMNKQEACLNIHFSFSHKYFVHRQRVRQLVHIFRVLLLPGAHATLISSEKGTGRKTTVRCAAHLTGCELLEVDSANEKALHEILKDARSRTRVEGAQVMILVHEDISLPVREQLLVAMAQRTYPGLCTEDELRHHISTVTSTSHSKRYLMDHWMLDKYLGQIHKNIHIFLLLPHTSKASTRKTSSQWNAQMTKALSRSCCVEVYRPWSYDSLVDVATHCLKTSCHESPKIEGSVSSISMAMAHIHQSACQYSAALLTHQSFSPRTYMEFIAHFCDFSKLMHKQGLQRANRVGAVLSRLDAMTRTALRDLVRQREKAAGIQQEQRAVLRAISEQEELLQDAQHRCVLEEDRLCQLEQDIHKTKLKIKSIFESGVRMVTCLSVSDLEEVRSYRDPPEAVVLILDAVCLLFQRPLGWDSAKHLLSQSNFFQELEYFDHQSLTKQQLQQLSQLVCSPNFDPQYVREASKACESLCHWVLAVYECCCMHQPLVVNQRLQAQAADARDRLQLARRQKEEACRCLKNLKLWLQTVREELKEQMLLLQEAESLEKEAAATVGKLGKYVAKWKDDAQREALRSEALPGDALIIAAIISYLGPFGPDLRSELISKWRELCKTGSINSVPNDPRTSLFAQSDSATCGTCSGFPLSVSEPLQQSLARSLGLCEWQAQGLSLSSLVTGLLLWSCTWNSLQHVPLLADPHYCLDKSSQINSILKEKAEAIKDYDMEVCADDKDFLNKLDQAAAAGVRVLVRHVERALPCPRFLSMLSHPAACVLPIAKSVVPTHPNFCPVFSTHLPVHMLSSEIHPSILTKLHVVDLSLSSKEIETLMLTQLFHPECDDLLSQHSQMQKQSLQEKQLTEEVSVMDYILQCEGSLLEDPDFGAQVSLFHEVTERLQAELEQMDDVLQWCERALAAPRSVIRLASALYQVLQQVAALSPAYYFSLERFTAVVKDALLGKVRQLVSFPNVSRGIIEEVSDQMVAQVLLHYRPCLFKTHARVLQLLLCVALIKHKQLCSEAESQAFLQGLGSTKHLRIKADLPCPVLPDWIPAHVHSELLCLEQIPAFSGLLSSLCSCPEQWQEYLSVPSTATGLVPCGPYSHLSLLQRALLWRTLLPHCLQDLAEGLATCYLGISVKNALETPHNGNPQALSQLLLQHKGPVVVTSPSPCGDETPGFQPLQLIKQLANCMQVQVKVICFGSLWEQQAIVSTLEKAVKNGLWLVFKNCHLLKQWDNQVVAQIFRLLLSPKGSLDKARLTSISFRLWFITREDTLHFIPFAVRMCALVFVSDSCWNLKEELSSSLQQMASIIQSRSYSEGADMEPLFRSAIFHSVLLQRQAYRRSGRGKLYHWTEADLLTLIEAYSCIAPLFHDKLKVLHYVAVNLVHGGHVLDSADLEEVRSVAQVCLRTESECATLPYSLSNLFSKYHFFDLPGLCEVLDDVLMDSTDSQDYLWLGFGADVSTEILQMQSHRLNILLQAPLSPLRSQQYSSSEQVLYREQLQALMASMTNRARALGSASCGPLQDFLLSEWDQLWSLVSSLLSQSEPAEWSKLMQLRDLERRAELLSAYLWHHDSADPADAYRLSAFKNPRGFLVALMRQAAQIYRKYISDIMLCFQVLSDGAYPLSLPPESVYLCGLELRGAAWDTERGVIQDTLSAAPSLVSLICVTAAVRSTNNAHASDSRTEHLPVYQCPLYVQAAGQSSFGLEDHNVITVVPLHSSLEPELCSLRRLRLVSNL